jgi:Fic family protein
MNGRFVSRTWRHDPALAAPAKYRRACRYEAFIPALLADLRIVLEGEAAGFISDSEAAIRRLNTGAAPALAPLARLLMRTESIASSKVEGLQVDVRQLARAEAMEETGRMAGPTAREILGNIDAMQLAVDEAATADRFSVAEILAIHRRLMERAPNAHIAGRVRTVQNWIGGSDWNPCGAAFVPPPPEEVRALLDDLCDAVNRDVLPPLVQAALVHAQFETIHPFDDGNGRAGRALIHVVLKRRGVAPDYVPPISVALASDRDRYIGGLVDYRKGRTDAWLERFAAAAGRAARLASDYLSAVRDLSDQWRDMLSASPSAPRADSAAWSIIEILPAHPIVTAPVAAAATGRSKPQIYRAIELLETSGVLIPLSRGRRNRSWEATRLLDLLAGLEAGRPL